MSIQWNDEANGVVMSNGYRFEITKKKHRKNKYKSLFELRDLKTAEVQVFDSAAAAKAHAEETLRKEIDKPVGFRHDLRKAAGS
jgi:hypothetical protein